MSESDGLPYLSHSRLQTYNSCGEKFKLSYVDKVPKAASGFFMGGIAVHETIEQSEALGWWEDEQVLIRKDTPMTDFFQQKLTDLMERMGKDGIYWGGRGNGEDEKWWRFQGPLFLRRYAHVRQTDRDEGKVIKTATEIEVNAKLPTGLRLTTRIDSFLITDQDGEMFLRDWKTGRVGGTDPIQLATYCWAVEQEMGIHPAYCETVYLRAGSRDRDERISRDKLDELVPLMPDMYAQAERQIRDGFFPLRPSWNCKSCAVRAHCPYGKHLEGT